LASNGSEPGRDYFRRRIAELSPDAGR
jgi:hypothetical protein